MDGKRRTADRVRDPTRLAALRATGLLELPATTALDRLTGLAARILDAPVSLVSLVDADRQVFASDCGLSGLLAEARQTPLSHSYCRYVVRDDAALIVPDARCDERLRDNPAIAEYDAIAYAGIPLRSPEGHVLGSFCVLDTRPRHWSEEQVAILSDLAAAAEAEVALRLAHAELLVSAARTRAVLDSLDNGVAACDAEGRLTLVNQAMRRIHPAAEQSPGRRDWLGAGQLFRADGRTPLPPDRTPLARAFAGDAVTGEHVVARAPGAEPRRFVANARPIDTPDGRRMGAVVAMHDITVAYSAERRRRCEHAVSRVLAEAASAREAATAAAATVAEQLGWVCAEYWEVDDERQRICRVGSWTTPGRDLSAFTGDEGLAFVRGQGLPGTVWERDAVVWSDRSPQAMAKPGRLAVAEALGLQSAIGLPVRCAGRVAAVMTFFTDVDTPRDDDVLGMLDGLAAQISRFVERRRAEDLALALAAAQHRLLAEEQQQVRRLRELDRMKDELVAVVSHELRNPIGIIAGYVELLSDEPELAGRSELAGLQRTAAHLLHLVDDLLDLARLDSGDGGLDLRPLAPARLIREVVQAHRHGAAARQVRLEAEIGTLPIVHGDAARLRQVLDNLLSNALKYTPAGGTVTVTAAGAGDCVRVTVDDTGIGIPAEQHPKLFTRFFRASTATERGIKGTGLGLAVTKAIVDGHHGRISAAPRLEGGTRFTVELPALQ